MRTALFFRPGQIADPEVQHSGKDAQDIARQNIKKSAVPRQKRRPSSHGPYKIFIAFICKPLRTQESAPRTFPTTLAIDARRSSASLSMSPKYG
jgi:hypothetical protein